MDTFDEGPIAVPRVVVYRLTDASAQQRLLDDFRTAAMLGVRALGTVEPNGPRLTVRCGGAGDAVLVDHVVRQLDPDAERVSDSGAPIRHPSARLLPAEDTTPT